MLWFSGWLFSVIHADVHHRRSRVDNVYSRSDLHADMEADTMRCISLAFPGRHERLDVRTMTRVVNGSLFQVRTTSNARVKKG